ncbi:MAG: energy transducer TonB [Gammaproteobacteria bacterium]|nr:energy transducer TonB [Gammaproteobacteria bacterium]
MQTRYGRPFLYAGGFTVALFWLMHLAISGGLHAGDKAKSLPTIDFVRLKKQSELETRERRKPPKPPPPKQPPPPPKMAMKIPTPQQTPVPFNMPKLNIPTQISGGPFLGGYTGDTSAFGELIPLVRIQPQYPRNALRDNIQGWVDMELIVNPDGSVKSARPVAAQPRGVFEAAAVQAIMKWRFKPKVVDGKPVEQRAIQRLDFKLEE